MDKNAILRVGSRLLNAEIDDDAKCPMILPRKDPNVRAMLDYVHKYKLKHAGPKHMLNSLRQGGYWIIHGAQECRSLVAKCHNCIRAFKKPMEQKMDILP